MDSKSLPWWRLQLQTMPSRLVCACVVCFVANSHTCTALHCTVRHANANTATTPWMASHTHIHTNIILQHIHDVTSRTSSLTIHTYLGTYIHTTGVPTLLSCVMLYSLLSFCPLHPSFLSFPFFLSLRAQIAHIAQTAQIAQIAQIANGRRAIDRRMFPANAAGFCGATVVPVGWSGRGANLVRWHLRLGRHNARRIDVGQEPHSRRTVGIPIAWGDI